MRSIANVDIGKYIMEGMLTIFIVLIFLLIAQNWVLTNTGETSFTTTCSLSDGLYRQAARCCAFAVHGGQVLSENLASQHVPVIEPWMIFR